MKRRRRRSSVVVGVVVGVVVASQRGIQLGMGQDSALEEAKRHANGPLAVVAAVDVMLFVHGFDVASQLVCAQQSAADEDHQQGVSFLLPRRQGGIAQVYRHPQQTLYPANVVWPPMAWNERGLARSIVEWQAQRLCRGEVSRAPRDVGAHRQHQSHYGPHFCARNGNS